MTVFLFISLAMGNGQSSHCWISEQAIQQLPEGELRELMTDQGLEIQWRNGTMFPDGGYAVGDDYGERAHWESFQLAYLEWIQEQYSKPWSPEAKEHIAFLMGLASHGLADQSYDSMYYRRGYRYDVTGNWDESFDTATDVAFVAQTAPQPLVDKWIPTDLFQQLYAEQGHVVDAETMQQGQTLLKVAIEWVGSISQQEDALNEYRSDFPWGTSNQLNESVPGSPVVEVGIVAAYWQVLWAQLNNEVPPKEILYSYPAEERYEFPIEKDNIEAELSIVFSKGIDADSLSEEMFSIQGSTGDYHPIGIDLFYGADSHVINITPLDDWTLDDFRLTVSAELPFMDGSQLGEDWILFFSTKEKPMETVEQKRGCQSVQEIDRGMLAIVLLLYSRRRA